MANVQEIKDVVNLAIGVGELVDAVSDGVSLGDVMQLVGLLKKVKPAVDAVKSGKLIDQVKQLDQASQDELKKWFEAELDLKDDAMEQVIEQAWVVVLGLSELVKLVKP